MKIIPLLLLAVLTLTACGGGNGLGSQNNAPNGTNNNSATFEVPPSPGK